MLCFVFFFSLVGNAYSDLFVFGIPQTIICIEAHSSKLDDVEVRARLWPMDRGLRVGTMTAVKVQSIALY